ncbi:hypothetical protein ACWIGI_28385 [Nocardia sp. NPDC055321]
MLYAILWLAPLVSWALIARTWRGRIIGLLVLGVLAGAQLVMWHAWLGREYQLTSLAVLTGTIMFVVVVGPVLDIFWAPPPPARSAHVRMALGWLLNASYILLCAPILLLSAGVVGMFGRYSWVPEEDALGALPAGLSLQETIDGGCTPRSSASSCDRNFVIVGENLTPDQTADRVRSHLESTAGWTFTPSRSGHATTRASWKGVCRMQGRALDRYNACSWVSIKDSGIVVVQLSYQDDW